MARITPAHANQVNLDQLQDYEPYLVTLASNPDFEAGSAEYGGDRRMVLDWLLPDGVQTIRDWLGLKLGKNQSGEVAKLRKLLNALAGRPEQTEVAWFDDESFEWSYDGTYPAARLQPGMTVTIRGKRGFRQDGTTPKYTITAYQTATPQATIPAAPVMQPAPAPAPTPPPMAAVTPPPAPAPVAAHPKHRPEDDEVPF